MHETSPQGFKQQLLVAKLFLGAYEDLLLRQRSRATRGPPLRPGIGRPRLHAFEWPGTLQSRPSFHEGRLLSSPKTSFRTSSMPERTRSSSPFAATLHTSPVSLVPQGFKQKLLVVAPFLLACEDFECLCRQRSVTQTLAQGSSHCCKIILNKAP